MKVSVIMPVERTDAQRAIESVLQQEAPFAFELIVVSAAPLALPAETRVRNVVEPNRNPATRRNRAVSVAGGEILAFIDDDAVADRDWLATACAYLDAHPDVLAIGGPDPAPDDSTAAEFMSDTLLATRWIGSGVVAHENRSGVFAITHPSDVALVNLFVRRSAFDGFDEAIGYIGEDTALLERVMTRGPVVYHSGVRVHHRRRPFPGQYLRQRWRYRVKTGEMLMQPAYRRNPKIGMFFAAAAVMFVFFPILAGPYYVFTLILGATATRLPRRYWPAIPFAFAAHHVTYFVAIIWGALAVRLHRRRRQS
jgi:glycosyltransferase involved in cell wall biosynthesis